MYKFDEKNHVHTFDGKRLHGVTTVLGYWGNPGALVNWAAKQAVEYIANHDEELTEDVLEAAKTAHIRKRDAAGDTGTKIHKELEEAALEWIQDGVVSEDHSPITLKVISYLRDNGFIPIKAEANLYSEEMWLGGIVDLICQKNGEIYIMDFKTSGTVQTKHFYQMGAYAAMYGGEVKGVAVIHIPRGKSFNPDGNVYIRYDVDELSSAFQNILEVYKLDREVSKLISY